VRAFETLDPDAVVSFYHLPCMFIGPPGVTLVSDSNAARGMASHLIEHARSQGYRRTEIYDLEVRTLAESLASISGVLARFNSNEEEISRFGFAYTMRKDAAGWKIVVAVAHDVSSKGT
jgi:hypothetical protein